MSRSIATLLNTFNVLRNINPEQDIIGRFGEAFIPRGNERNRRSYYDEASSNNYLKLASGYAKGVNPLAGWLTNGIGTGIVAGISSGNPFVGLAAGGASLITGIPSLVGNIRDREKREKAAQEEQKRKADIRAAASGVKDLTARYGEMQKTLDNLIGMVKTQVPQNGLTPERTAENNKVAENLEEASANANAVNRYNNLQIQRAASFSVFPTPPVVKKRPIVRAALPDRRAFATNRTSFFSII